MSRPPIVWQEPGADWAAKLRGRRYFRWLRFWDNTHRWVGASPERDPVCRRCDDTGIVRFDSFGSPLLDDEPCPDCFPPASSDLR